MKYTIQKFDTCIARKYKEEIKEYLENNDLSFDATYKRILKTIDENPKLSDFIKKLLKRSCYLILKDIYKTNIPPFILEYNLQFLESQEFNKYDINSDIRAIIDFRSKEKRIILKHKPIMAPKRFFKNKKLSYKQREEWIFYEIYHEAKHLASIPLDNKYSFYESIDPCLNEVLTEIIGLPIHQRKHFFGYGTLCARIFPSYYLLNDKEKKKVTEVFYGGKRTLVQNKPYFRTWISSLENYTHPFQSFKKILTEKNYENYYNIGILENGFDPFNYLYNKEYYKKSFVTTNFLNQRAGCNQYVLNEHAPKIRQVRFQTSPKSKISNLRIYDIKRKYHPLPPHKLLKQKKMAKKLEIKLQKSGIPFRFAISNHVKSELQKKITNFNLYYYEKERTEYQKRNFLNTIKLYAIKDQFQATHEYDSNHRIKQKRL